MSTYTVNPTLTSFANGGGNRRYQRKTRLANGRLVYEPKFGLQECTHYDGLTYWVIRQHGQILLIGAWRKREDAVNAIKRLWRPDPASKHVETPF